MPFASFNPTDPRTSPLNFQKKYQEKKIQKANFSKSPFFKITNSQKIFAKFHRLVLGSVGLNDAKGIDEAQRIWP